MDKLKIILPILIVSLLSLNNKALSAPIEVRIQNNEALIICEEALRPVADDSLKLYTKIKMELERTIGWPILFKSTVVLINDSSMFQSMAGNKYIVAFAQPSKDIIVIDYSKMMTDPFTLEAIMKHELCHLLLHRYIDGKNLPKWLDEGIAQFVSGGIVDMVMDQKRPILNQAILSGKYINIRSLDNRFPGDRNSLILAYAESKDFVEYIIREYEINSLLVLLENLKNGNTIDSAVTNSLSVSLDELENNWINSMGKGVSWVYFIINYLYEILFFIGAVLLIYGFIRVVLKKRAYDQDENDGKGSNL